jgi:hypothetical protein
VEVLITTIVTITLALIGYVATYLNNIRMSRHQARLERINRQLSELYGPMLATLEGGERDGGIFYESIGQTNAASSLRV